MTKPDAPPVIPLPFRSGEELGRYIPFLVTRLANGWTTNQAEFLSEMGLNGTMFRILASLSAYEQLTINQLSTLSITEQSTTSRTVEQLVSQGYVERRINPEDQRARRVVLSDAGRAILARIAPSIGMAYADLRNGIPEKDLEICIAVLKRMARNIGEGGL